ncbi:hypothetical protein CerSpe_235240 [Prunus speciosa]
MAAAAETTSNSADSFPNLRIIVESNPSDSRLSELGINSWPKWGCPPGKYTLKFDAAETCYLVKGKVKVYPKKAAASSSSSSSHHHHHHHQDVVEFVEFGAGDLVTIPKGLSCTWDVSVAVDKHYKFDSS